jgi:leucyl-tRNA synthetase
LFNQGYILAAAYTDDRGVYVPADEVEEREDATYWWRDVPVKREYGKMGKSLKNSVAPDEVYETYGADTLRLYEMSTGPLDADRPWQTRDIVGVHRFLQRLWRNLVDEETGASRVVEDALDDDSRKVLHRTIHIVGREFRALRLNTAIARLMELNKHLTGVVGDGCPREGADSIVLMLAPLAPHIAEELWSRSGHNTTLTYEPFPEADPALLEEVEIDMGVEIDGRRRARVTVPVTASTTEIERLAMADPRAQAHLAGRTVRRVIVVPGRVVSIVTKGGPS